MGDVGGDNAVCETPRRTPSTPSQGKRAMAWRPHGGRGGRGPLSRDALSKEEEDNLMAQNEKGLDDMENNIRALKEVQTQTHIMHVARIITYYRPWRRCGSTLRYITYIKCPSGG